MLPQQFSIKGDIWGWHISNVVQNRVNNYDEKWVGGSETNKHADKKGKNPG